MKKSIAVIALVVLSFAVAQNAMAQATAHRTSRWPSTQSTRLRLQAILVQ